MIFRILPILFLAITPMLYDVTTILRSAIIAIAPLIVYLIKPFSFRKYKYISLIFLALILIYAMSWQVNNQSWVSFLFGSYGRGDGVLSLVGLFLIFILSIEEVVSSKKVLEKSLHTVMIFTLIYGVAQAFNIDPVNWAKDYIGGGLTLGNPNFASALFGILSGLPLANAFLNKGLKRYINIIYFFLFGLLILKSFSSQGVLFYIITVCFLSMFKIKEIKISKKLVISLLSFLTLFTTVSIMLLLKNIKLSGLLKSINNNLHISDRINHWKLAVRIWNDHIWFGVGISDMQKYSGMYLTEGDVKIWGNYLHPDKAHNVLLDHLVNGGIFVFILYLSFIIFVSFISINLIKLRNKSKDQWQYVVLTSMWINYVIQSLISPSHPFLDALGMICGGAILGFYQFEKVVKK